LQGNRKKYERCFLTEKKCILGDGGNAYERRTHWKILLKQRGKAAHPKKKPKNLAKNTLLGDDREEAQKGCTGTRRRTHMGGEPGKGPSLTAICLQGRKNWKGKTEARQEGNRDKRKHQFVSSRKREPEKHHEGWGKY